MLTSMVRFKTIIGIIILNLAVIAARQPADADNNQTSSVNPGANTQTNVGRISPFEQHVYSQTFRDAKHCLERGLRTETLYNRVVICKSKAYNGNANPANCGAAEKKLESSTGPMGGPGETQVCSADPKVLRDNFGDAIVKAAETGDVDAQLCYIEGTWATSSGTESAFYVRKAQRYMKRALDRGDWRILDLLAVTKEDIGSGEGGRMVNLPITGSPFTVYRATRLLEKGMTGKYLDVLKMKASYAKADLSRPQIKNANAWVLQQYNLHFRNSPKLSSQPVACINYASLAY